MAGVVRRSRIATGVWFALVIGWPYVALAGDWPQYQHDAARSGFNPTERLSMPLSLRFTLSLNDTGGETVFNLASAVTDGSTVYASSTEGDVVAVDRVTGSELWRAVLTSPVRGVPAVAGDRVVVTTSDGGVVGLNPQLNGYPAWRFSSSGAILASPAVVRAGVEWRAYVATADGVLVCLRANDGGLVWRSSTTGPMWNSPSVRGAGDRVYVASGDGRISVFDASSGEVIWTSDPVAIPTGPGRAAVVAHGTRLYVATVAVGLVAVEDTGSNPALRWSFSLSGVAAAPVVVPTSGLASATVYVATDQGTVVAVEDRGIVGYEAWRMPVGGGVMGALAFGGNHLVAASEDGTLTFLLGGGSGIASFAASTTLTTASAPAIARGRVYVTDGGDRLHAFGNVLEPPENVTASPEGGGIRLSWTPVELSPQLVVSGYSVYRSSRSDGGFEPVAFVPGSLVVATEQGAVVLTASTYLDTAPATSCLYYYAVTARHELTGLAPLEESTYSDTAGPVAPPVGVSLAIDRAPPVPGIGDAVTYRIIVANTGMVVMDALTLVDTLPAVMDNVTAEQPARFPPAVVTRTDVTAVVWTGTELGMMPGTALTFTVTAQIGLPCQTTTVMNEAVVTAGSACGATSSQATASTFVVTPPVASVSVLKTQTPASPTIGDVVTYRLVVTNTGQATLDSLTVTDTISPLLVGVATRQPPAFRPRSIVSVPAGPLVVWDENRPLGMSPGTTYTFTVTGAVSLVCASPQTVVNEATAIAPAACGVTAFTSAPTSFTVTPPVTALAVTKTQSYTSPNPGGTVIYRIIVANTGTATLTSLTVVDTFATLFSSFDIRQPSPFGSPTVVSVLSGTGLRFTWSSGVSLSPGRSFTFTVTGTIGTVCAYVQVTNRAAAVGATGCGIAAALSDAVSFTAAPVFPGVAITKFQSASAPRSGDTFSYALQVVNTGQAPVVELTVVDTVPALLASLQTYQPAGFNPVSLTGVPGGTRIVWRGVSPAFPGGSSLFFYVLGKVALVCTPRTVSNKAVVVARSQCFTAAEQSNTVSATVTPPVTSLSVVKSLSPSDPPTGGPVTYRIVVTNTGTATVANVDVVDSLTTLLYAVTTSQPSVFGPPQITPIKSGGFFFKKTIGWRYRWSASGLAMPPGASFTFTITAAVGLVCSPATIVNSADVWTQGPCGPYFQRSNTVSFTATPPVSSLTIAKTLSPAAPLPGGPLTYTILVGNTGQGPLGGVSVVDTVPDAILGLATAQPAGYPAPKLTAVSGGTRIEWNGAGTSLPVASSATFSVMGTAQSSCVPLLVTNRAVVTGAGFCGEPLGVQSDPVSFTVSPSQPFPVSLLTVVKTSMPPSPQPGEPLTYRIDIVNGTGETLTEVNVTDTIASALTGVTTDEPAALKPVNVTAAPGGAQYVWGKSSTALPPGGRFSVTIMGTVDPGAGGVLANTALVTGLSACGPFAVLSNETVTVLQSPLLVRAGDGLVEVSWPEGLVEPDATEVRLYRQEGAGALVLFRTLPSGATAFHDLRVENGIVYTYVLKSVGANHQEGVALGTGSGTPLTRDWPMFQRDMLHEANDPGQSVPPPLGERWRVAFNLHPSGATFTSYQGGIVVGGTLYATSIAGDVRAYDALTGAPLWSSTVAFETASTPAYHHGRLYVTHQGPVNGLTVFDAATGAVAWTLPLSVAGRGQESSPVVYKGRLYAGVIRDGAFKLVAIDVDPSSSTYRQAVWASAGMPVFLKSSPAASAGRVYVVDGAGVVRAFDAATGSPVWTRSLGAYATATEAVSLSALPPVVLVVHENGTLYAFDAADGNLRWQQALGVKYTAPAVSGTTVFVSSNAANTVHAVDVRTGAVRWTGHTFTVTGAVFQGAPVVADGRVHLYATNGQLFTLDAATGATLDAAQLAMRVQQSHFCAASGQLYIPTLDGEIIAVTPVAPAPLDLTASATGEGVVLTWTPAAPNGFAVSGYRLFRTTESGEVGASWADVPGPAASSFLDAAPPASETVFYRVAAIDVRGVTGRLSEAAVADTSGITIVRSPGSEPLAVVKALETGH